MNNKKNKEELQSRREFFKKAAKATLPVIGAVVLASTPLLGKAATATTGCNFCQVGCSGSCSESCLYGCLQYCKGGCLTTSRNY
ncbi:MAG: Cys-Xaa-Xaa-Xaa repeat radical SAM target protein [Prevotella sp.]|nr:Cys-Xaa-Xaa-Xaa repeat radical SAM target protein [Prevotella sp.]